MATLPDAGPTSPPASVAPRPPTPPRESNREPAAALKPGPGRPDLSDSCPSPLQTPPAANTPTSTSGGPDSSLKSRRKRVEWSAHTEYKEYFDVRRLERLAKSSPISALSPRPIKGILKPSQSHNLGPSSLVLISDGPNGQVNIIDMLDSTIKQLAGSDRHSKIDAYMMLSRALKASNNLPDRVALQTKMSLFMHFIQRDVAFKNPNGTSDPSLTNHALTLLATFLHFPAIASTLTTDFGIWTLDYAIRALEDASTPKDILRHLMQIIASQSFSSKVMTSTRVGRLVKALHHIENHAKGKSIVMSRIRIYKRLVKQSKGPMAHHLDWIEDVFVDMLSTAPEIRAQAINLATEAGFALRSETPVSRKVDDILCTTNENTTYIDFFLNRMNEMLGERQASASVPQIWATVILYLPYPLDRWRHYSPWLKLVQSAFNSDDNLTKQEANHAWNRHIYLTLHDTGKMSSKALALLCLPLLTQIRKKANPKNPEAAAKLRKTVIGGICTALYYLLAPGNDLHSNDFVWKIAIQPFIAELINLDGKPDIPTGCLTQAASLLLGLLDSTTPRAWAHDRIQRSSPVTPDELPSLDARWIRRNCDKIMQTVSPIIEKRFLDLANQESVVFRLWHAMVGSVALASAKDIKVSEETVKFIACAFGLLSRIWATERIDGGGSLGAAFLPALGNFISVLRDTLGLLPFTEKRLSMSADHTFRPLPTPHTPDRTNDDDAINRPILHHLFLILSSGPQVAQDDGALTNFFLSVFDPFLNGKTVAARIDLVSELLSVLPDGRPSLSAPWIMAARNFHCLIESYRDGGVLGAANNGKILGPTFREIVSLLEQGVTKYQGLPVDQWFSLFDRLSEHVADKFGEAGRCIILIEPLAKVLLDLFDNQTDKMSHTGLHITKALFEIAKFPRDRASLEIARHRLWGTPMNTARGSIFDPFEYLYKLGNHVLEVFYQQFRLYDPGEDVAPLIEVLKDFIIRCFPLSRARTLSRLQPGLCYWIRDSKTLLGDSLLSNTVFVAWHQVSWELASRRPLDRSEFDSVESILSSAFQSKHARISRRSVEIWTLLTQGEVPTDCSDGLKSLAITSSSRLEVTHASEQSTEVFGAQASYCPRPASNASLVLLSSASSSQNVQTPLSPSASDSAGAPKRSKRKRRSESASDGSRTKSAKKTATPKSQPRHEQLQSAVAPFSPSPQAGDGVQKASGRQRGSREKRREKTVASPQNPESSPPRPVEITQESDQAILQGQGEKPPQHVADTNVAIVTPTPRQGQCSQNEDEDSALSILEPRPYLLLPEVPSRSRESIASNAEDRGPSAPGGAQSTGHQQELNMIKPPPVQLATSSTPIPAKARKGAQSRSSAKRVQAAVPPPLPPPSAAAADLQQECRDVEMADLGSALEGAQNARSPAVEGNPQTPRKQRAGISPVGEESPGSVDEEFVDAKSNFEGKAAALPEAGGDSASSSFSLSELDDSSMMQLIVELQSHDGSGEGPSRGEGSARWGEEENEEAQEEEERVSANVVELQGAQDQTPPHRPQRTAKKSKRAASPSLPPLIPEGNTGSAALKTPGQKRKRSAPAQHSNQGKKRRTDLEEIPETPGMQPKPGEEIASPERNLRRSNRRPPLPSVSGVQTRGSTRRRPQAEEPTAEGSRTRAGRQNQARQEAQQDDDKPDTDDEVLSQLMSESIASSHDLSHIEQELRGEGRMHHQEAAKPPDTTAIPDSGLVRDADVQDANGPEDVEAASPRRRAEAQAQAQTQVQFSSLLQGLQSGLEELRMASLSRDEFNRMEDVLMDMKRELFAAEERGRGRGRGRERTR